MMRYLRNNNFHLVAISLLFLIFSACSGELGQTQSQGTPKNAEDCKSDETHCGTICTDAQSDAKNCGGCGIVCDSGDICAAGTCTTPCANGGLSCGGTCIDTTADAENCGGCGVSCGAGGECVDSACVCDNGLDTCSKGCKDLSQDPAHCGECNTACPASGFNVTAATCTDGGCGVVCKDNWDSCDGNPASGCETHIATNKDNCGACGNACRDDQACSNAECGCPQGQEECDGTCVDTQEDDNNCGACGNVCGDGLECHQSACVVCKPGRFMCDGDSVKVCKNGTSWEEESYCDPLMGLSCNEQFGQCDGACSQQALGSYYMSYVGCEYYPTVTANLVPNSLDYAVAISNTSDEPATVTITGGALAQPLTVTIAPSSLEVQALPWVLPLKNPVSILSTNGAYRLRSTRPVTVYQFSALQYQKNGVFSYTNDASMLMPVNVMTGKYYVAAWQFWQNGYPGLMAITATQNDTEVIVNSRAQIAGSATVPAFAANQPTTFTLQAGDVLQLTNTGGDLTGSHLSSNKPIQVIGGHYCTNIPLNITACDHVEESIFPYETLSDHYIVTSPAVPAIPNGKIQNVRVIATSPNTELTFDPPQPGVPTTIANAGEFVELRNDASYVVSSNERVLVAQYMNGQQAGGNTGDPAMALAVGTAQFREDYMFHAPTNYDTNYVNIVAPDGATIILDGEALTDFTPIGTSGYSLLRKQLPKLGNHIITGDKPFGISVYGYGQYTSYWYPGGLNLELL